MFRNFVEGDIIMKKEVTESKNLDFHKFLKYHQNSKTSLIEQTSLIQTYINGRTCPHCNSHNISRNGNYKGRKRYICKDCHKTYNDLTGTPFSGFHNLKKVESYIDCLIKGLSIRKSASIVNISISTSFEWRHKLLKFFSRLKSPQMKSLLEVIEVKIPFSAKGQRNPATKEQQNRKVSLLFVSDRHGKCDSDAEFYHNRTKNKIFKRLNALDNKEMQIIAKKGLAIRAFTKSQTKITLSTEQQNPYSNTNIANEKITEWKNWMAHFHGVATKYIRNYLHWFNFLGNSSHKNNPTQTLINRLSHYVNSTETEYLLT
jgi:transposase-like protein